MDSLFRFFVHRYPKDLFRKQLRQFLLIEFGADHADLAGKLCLSLADIDLAGHIVKISPLACAVRQHAFCAEHKAVNVFLLQHFEAGSDLILCVGSCRLTSPTGEDLIRMMVMLMIMVVTATGAALSVIMMMVMVMIVMMFVVMIVMMLMVMILMMVIVAVLLMIVIMLMFMIVVMLLMMFMVVMMMLVIMAAASAVLIMLFLNLGKELCLKIHLLLHGV